MNREAQKHIEKAASYYARGQGFYRKAASEIEAAKEAGATWVEIANALGRSTSWVAKIVAWAKTPADDLSVPTPFAEPDREDTDTRGTRRLLRDAPLEQVEALLAGLSSERQEAIAAAAGNAYFLARRTAKEEKKQRKGQKKDEHRNTRQAVGGFTALGIVQHIEQATEELRELVADASLSLDAAKAIERALDALVHEFDFAQQMVGGGDEA